MDKQVSIETSLQEAVTILKDILEKLPSKGEEKEPQFDFIDNADLLKLLNISARTAQGWREKGIVSFSQIGAKLYYKKSEIVKMLMERFNRKIKLS